VTRFARIRRAAWPVPLLACRDRPQISSNFQSHHSLADLAGGIAHRRVRLSYRLNGTLSKVRAVQGIRMVVRLMACGAIILCLNDPASADDVIYNGLHCNSLCQRWLGIEPTGALPKKNQCSYIVSHPDQFDADLLRLCQAAERGGQ
jgi:hypothetical protein